MLINDEIIRDIIGSKSIYVEFQPIYSFNTKRVIGFEALSRGQYGNERISPYFLFNYAKENKELLKLDTLCREKALEAFKQGNYSSTLFVNFETSILNTTVPKDDEFFNSEKDYGIPPENIVVELNEANVRDAYNLLMFVDQCRSRGFLIALDNVSNGLETQNRIMLVNPDIIKIDRAIVSNISSNEYNREVFRSIIHTAKQIGAMTVAEGVETLDEVVACMLMGVDYFQGFFFSKPESFDYIFSNEFRLKLEDAAHKLNVSMKNNPTVANVKLETYKRIIRGLVSRISKVEPGKYTDELEKYIDEHSEIECVYLINSKGFQITPTIMQKDVAPGEGFIPTVIGVNHGIKNYFYAVKEQIEDPFISGWYISAATGNKCKTISSHFTDETGELIVVCADLKRNQS